MKFEYKHIEITFAYDDQKMESILNEWGNEGWELVTLQIDRGLATSSTYLVFKRKCA